jgi:hypothetical protein
MNFLISFLFVIGLFMPTSMHAQITKTYTVIGSIMLGLALIYLIIKQKEIKVTSFIYILLINGLLWLFTLITSAPKNSYGTALYFFDLSLLFCLDLKNIEMKRKTLSITFIVVNIVNIVIGLGLIINISAIKNLIVNFYSDFYSDLLMYMMAANKPVNTFASHSLAGFYHFIFFLLNIISYRKTKNSVFLVMSVFYVLFLWYTSSNTSYLFLIICLAILMSLLFQHKRIFFTTLSIVGIYYLVHSYTIDQSIMKTYESFNTIFNSQGSGLISRYANSGNLNANFNYIGQHPLEPVGFGYFKDLKYGDSGIVEYTLRGSILLLVTILVGFFYFLKTNLEKKYAYIFFSVFFIFEIGFSNLIYSRTLLMFPFIILYLRMMSNETTIKEMQAEKVCTEKVILDV